MLWNKIKYIPKVYRAFKWIIRYYTTDGCLTPELDDLMRKHYKRHRRYW